MYSLWGGCRIPGGAALTMLDSLDTMKIMGLEEYFAEGAHWVENFLNLDRDAGISVFECNIRLLGGLISAYDLSGNNVFLNKARVVVWKHALLLRLLCVFLQFGGCHLRS